MKKQDTPVDSVIKDLLAKKAKNLTRNPFTKKSAHNLLNTTKVSFKAMKNPNDQADFEPSKDHQLSAKS